ncbi:MetQ/NlpA family ABC transporter substrate-binding protein [Alkalihalobacillus sp. 1P02AB]|uniref:MetQ/NlpA family ABC transporter substrate-binding protein n=1 Tax=Alkalihalobacillus sp. 1P02AB TaxID=3132260 RepID=UPI0039A54D9A
MLKNYLKSALIIGSMAFLVACGSSEATTGDTESGDSEKTKIMFGATTGPYSDMVNEAIKPLLEEKGYEVENREFTDYVQPNNALANGDLDANLFQHTVYLESFAEENNLELTNLIAVPTAPMGLYSNKFDSLEDIEDGSTIAIANDPTNLARTLGVLADAGLIEVNGDVDPLRVSVKDITANPKNLKLPEVEAGQLARLVENEDAAAVPGNFALAADFDLTAALILEDMPEQFRNVVAVNTSDADAQFVQDIKEVIESEEFETIIDEKFKGFGKPGWMGK